MPNRRDAVLARIRLRHLQCLLAVAEHGSLRRAAEVLAVSQPAVTKTLAELEALLGLHLIERGRRGARPTPEAEVFLRHARASLQSLGHAVDSVAPGSAEAPLRIGALPTLAPSVLPRAMLAFRAERPGADLRVTTGLNSELMAALRARELDVVVGRLSDPDEMAGLAFELLYAEPLAIVARAGHALVQGGAPVAAERLGLQPLVLPQAGTIIRHAIDGFLAAHGVVARQGVTETLSPSLARALVLGSDALWFTPLSAAEPDLDAGLLVRVPVSTAGTEEPVGLLVRTDSQPSPALQALLAALREQAAARRAAVAGQPPRRRRATKPTKAKPAPSKA